MVFTWPHVLHDSTSLWPHFHSFHRGAPLSSLTIPRTKASSSLSHLLIPPRRLVPPDLSKVHVLTLFASLLKHHSRREAFLDHLIQHSPSFLHLSPTPLQNMSLPATGAHFYLLTYFLSPQDNGSTMTTWVLGVSLFIVSPQPRRAPGTEEVFSALVEYLQNGRVCSNSSPAYATMVLCCQILMAVAQLPPQMSCKVSRAGDISFSSPAPRQSIYVGCLNRWMDRRIYQKSKHYAQGWPWAHSLTGKLICFQNLILSCVNEPCKCPPNWLYRQKHAGFFFF